MAAIIKQTNKKSGITYCYTSESYWVPELKQPRSRRRLIGKIDPNTGQMVPTGKSGPRRKNPPPTQSPAQPENVSELKADLIEANKTIQSLQQRLAEADATNARLTVAMNKMRGNLEGMQVAMSRYIDRCMKDCIEEA